MSHRRSTIERLTLTLGIASALGLLFILAVQPFHAEEIFVRRDTLTAVEWVMLVGFGLIVLFNVTSLAWLLGRSATGGDERTGDLLTALFGVVCVVLLAADKVMADEVAHEWGLEAGRPGEWFMLYTFLTVQLVYNVIVILKLTRLHELTAAH